MKITTTQKPVQMAEVYDKVLCDNCETELKLITFGDKYQEVERGRIPQCEDALDITLHGGYGGYYDGVEQYLICKTCADKLVELFPCFETIKRTRPWPQASSRIVRANEPHYI